MAYSIVATSSTPSLTIIKDMRISKLSLSVVSQSPTSSVSVLLNGANPTGNDTNYPNDPFIITTGGVYNDFAPVGSSIEQTVIDFSGLGSGICNVALY